MGPNWEHVAPLTANTATVDLAMQGTTLRKFIWAIDYCKL